MWNSFYNQLKLNTAHVCYPVDPIKNTVNVADTFAELTNNGFLEENAKMRLGSYVAQHCNQFKKNTMERTIRVCSLNEFRSIVTCSKIINIIIYADDSKSTVMKICNDWLNDTDKLGNKNIDYVAKY